MILINVEKIVARIAPKIPNSSTATNKNPNGIFEDSNDNRPYETAWGLNPIQMDVNTLDTNINGIKSAAKSSIPRSASVV